MTQICIVLTEQIERRLEKIKASP